MCDPFYFTKFTMKDYLAGQKKDVSHPPIPSGMDYIRANAFHYVTSGVLGGSGIRNIFLSVFFDQKKVWI